MLRRTAGALAAQAVRAARGCEASTSARAFASSPSGDPSLTWSDRVSLTGMRFWARHGVLPSERTLGARFDVDATAFLDLSAAAASDDVKDTLDYSRLHAIAKAVCEDGPPRDLIEVVAGEIAERVLDEFPAVVGVRVKVHKPGAPIQGAVFEGCAVEVRRKRM